MLDVWSPRAASTNPRIRRIGLTELRNYGTAGSRIDGTTQSSRIAEAQIRIGESTTSIGKRI
jgi:hypothetical protein